MEAPQGQDPLSPATVEARMRRFKPIWRVLLISNLALGAYMFAKVRQKNMRKEESISRRKRVEDARARAREEASEEQSLITPELEPPTLSSPPVVVKVREPLPEEQQRELFQWILEEKRKVKPKDRKEKKLTDQEKAILKRFIHAESIPKL